MAVRSNTLTSFSIQAILNKKEENRHLKDLDVCFPKATCWKIFGDLDTGTEDLPSPCKGEEGPCMASDRKSYDSDSGLSEENDSKSLSACKSEKDMGRSASDALEGSIQDETDHESTAIENAKGLSDCELSANVSGECGTIIYCYK